MQKTCDCAYKFPRSIKIKYVNFMETTKPIVWLEHPNIGWTETYHWKDKLLTLYIKELMPSFYPNRQRFCFISSDIGVFKDSFMCFHRLVNAQIGYFLLLTLPKKTKPKALQRKARVSFMYWNANCLNAEAPLCVL